jgi:NAD(P)-dependent dehydrogenase (short-subunit alcohol dehydrogenase family)
VQTEVMSNRAPVLSTTPLAGRAALVTGASGGLGRAIAVALAAGGADVCLVGRDKGRLADTVHGVSEYDTTVVSLAADLTQDGRVDQLVDLVDRRLGRLDVLVHAAGIYTRGKLAAAGIAELDALYQTNIRVPFQLTQAALPLLIRQRGDVVFVNSTRGRARGSRRV